MQDRTTNKLNLLALRRAYTNPHELYNMLREKDQLYFDEKSQSWLVTGHDVVTAILDDTRFVSGLGAAATISSPHMSSLHRQMLFMNGKVHKHAQNSILRPLALMVKQVPPTIREFARTAIKAICKKGEMDVVSEFASPVSLFTIAHVLGVPLHNRTELRQLESWSDTFGDITSGYFSGDIQSIQQLEDYFRHLIAEKRQSPSHDLLSAFIKAKDVFPDEDDIVANCMMVFSAGRITTKKLLGNGISLLMQQWERVRSESMKDPKLPKLLGEELLRMVTPTRCLIREAHEDVDLSSSFPGQHFIRRGQRVLLFLEAANYDPAIFSQPEKFHPHRHPNKHLAFGYGPHQCPGAALARVEMQIALEEVLSLSNLRPKPSVPPIWNPNPNLGGFASNPVLFEPSL